MARRKRSRRGTDTSPKSLAKRCCRLFWDRRLQRPFLDSPLCSGSEIRLRSSGLSRSQIQQTSCRQCSKHFLTRPLTPASPQCLPHAPGVEPHPPATGSAPPSAALCPGTRKSGFSKARWRKLCQVQQPSQYARREIQLQSSAGRPLPRLPHNVSRPRTHLPARRVGPRIRNSRRAACRKR